MIRYSVLLLFTLLSLNQLFAASLDSLRLEKEGDKYYIIHQVEEKETLYGLSRRYNVPITQILENNPDAKSGLEVGTLLRIPYVSKDAADNGEIHVVKPSETLFFISRLYNVTVEDIKKWNRLTSNDLNVGQKLIVKAGAIVQPGGVISGDSIFHIVKPSETLYGISREYNLQVADIRSWNKLPDNSISVGQKLFVGIEPTTVKEGIETTTSTKDTIQKAEPQTAKPVVEEKVVEEKPKEEVVYVGKTGPETITNSSGYTRRVENGLATLIEGTDDNKKYLALHRTAKIGTIMQVRNEMNNKVVFVRILGRLPDTGANNGVLIRLSKAAYDRLGALDKKFRVEISYVP